MPATINDVARRAGVQKRTVTRVINNEPYVSAAARARVEAAIAELGFVPNFAAQRLAFNRTFTIGLALGISMPDLVGSAVISTSRVAKEKGYALVVILFEPRDPASLVEVANLARRRMADGVILAAPLGDIGIDAAQLFPDGFPWVHIGASGTPHGVPNVSADDRAGAHQLAEYLVASGHRRIAYMSKGRFPFSERLEGFAAALAGRGIALDSRCVIVREDLTFEGGLSGGRTLLALEPRPTAICCANDAAAAGVLAAAQEAGIRVPEELSVAGFDDFPIAQLTRPALTSVRVPLAEMDRAASEMLTDLIEGRAPRELRVRLPFSLVVRQSTGPCHEPS